MLRAFSIFSGSPAPVTGNGLITLNSQWPALQNGQTACFDFACQSDPAAIGGNDVFQASSRPPALISISKDDVRLPSVVEADGVALVVGAKSI